MLINREDILEKHKILNKPSSGLVINGGVDVTVDVLDTNLVNGDVCSISDVDFSVFDNSDNTNIKTIAPTYLGAPFTFYPNNDSLIFGVKGLTATTASLFAMERTAEMWVDLTGVWFENPDEFLGKNIIAIAISEDTNYMCLSIATAPFIVVLSKASGKYRNDVTIDIQPVGSGKIVVSGDGKYMAEISAATPFMTLYKNVSGSFIKLPAVAQVNSKVNSIFFHENGRELLIGLQADFKVLLINNITDAVTEKVVNGKPTTSASAQACYLGDYSRILVLLSPTQSNTLNSTNYIFVDTGTSYSLASQNHENFVPGLVFGINRLSEKYAAIWLNSAGFLLLEFNWEDDSCIQTFIDMHGNLGYMTSTITFNVSSGGRHFLASAYRDRSGNHYPLLVRTDFGILKAKKVNNKLNYYTDFGIVKDKNNKIVTKILKARY